MSTKICASIDEIPPGYFLADCAVSGGTLEHYLLEALRESAGQLCIRLRPVYMDFPLPCPTGMGTELTAETLHRHYDGSPCHFSESLCTEYFTYLHENTAHAVLFDSHRSLRAKFELLQACGIPMVLIEDAALRRILAH